jgi:hypothetical protein
LRDFQNAQKTDLMLRIWGILMSLLTPYLLIFHTIPEVMNHAAGRNAGNNTELLEIGGAFTMWLASVSRSHSWKDGYAFY